MIKLITTKNSWVDGIAQKQIEQIAQFDGVESVAGLPDLHNGPVGVSVVSKNKIYPHLVGNDIGCGMALFQTDIRTHKVKLDKWERLLYGLNSYSEIDLDEFVETYGPIPDIYKGSMGTIGRGNHFAEFQKVHEIHDKQRFTDLGLDLKKIFFMVHSGSRGLGKSIMDHHVSSYGSVALDLGTDAATQYLKTHDEDLVWAEINRRCIAYRFSKRLGFQFDRVLDESHNGMWSLNDGRYVHRKGANPNTCGPVMIAGSRGSLSDLVQPKGDFEKSNFSLAHGAGRKHNRNEMKDRLFKKNKRAKDLTHTQFGGRVLCDDKKLLFEEAPEAYKNISQVITDLEAHGLIDVVASFSPLLTYKVKGECSC